MALASDRSWVLGRSEGAIASMDVIAAWDAASRALVWLGKRHDGGGGGGSPSPVGKESAEESEGKRVLKRCCDPVMKFEHNILV